MARYADHPSRSNGHMSGTLHGSTVSFVSILALVHLGSHDQH